MFTNYSIMPICKEVWQKVFLSKKNSIIQLIALHFFLTLISSILNVGVNLFLSALVFNTLYQILAVYIILSTHDVLFSSTKNNNQIIQFIKESFFRTLSTNLVLYTLVLGCILFMSSIAFAIISVIPLTLGVGSALTMIFSLIVGLIIIYIMARLAFAPFLSIIQFFTPLKANKISAGMSKDIQLLLYRLFLLQVSLILFFTLFASVAGISLFIGSILDIMLKICIAYICIQMITK